MTKRGVSSGEALLFMRREYLAARESRRMGVLGGAGGRSGIVAPRQQSRNVLSDQAIPMPEGGAAGGGSLTIDMGETTVLTGYSRTIYPMLDGTLSGVVGALGVAGSTDTVAEVIHWDGTVATTVATITIPAGDLYALVPVGQAFVDTDGWQMRVTTAGAGAAGLAFHGLFG